MYHLRGRAICKNNLESPMEATDKAVLGSSGDASDEMTAFNFRRSMMMNALISGNAYAEIVRRRDERGPAALHLVEPARVEIFRDPTRKLRYRIGNANGSNVELAAADVLHIMGPSRDGLVGLSAVAQAREAIGLGLVTEKFGARFFGNGSHFGMMLTHPKQLSPAARDNLKKSIREVPAHDIAVLEEGMTVERVSIPPEDAQFLSTRIFQIVEIARLFNMPPTLLAAAHDGLTYRNAAEEAQRFIDHCLLPWATCWEQELNRKLIPASERSTFYFSHNFAGLVRGDLSTRYAAYQIGRVGGWLSPNDVRRFEDLNPIDGGDAYNTPTASAPSVNGSESSASRMSVLGARRVVEEAVRRSLRREGDRAAKAASTVSSLQHWMNAFFTEAELAARAGELELALQTAGVPDAARIARATASSMIEQSKNELVSLARSAPSNLRTAAEDLAGNWVRFRPGAVADRIVAEAMTT